MVIRLVLSAFLAVFMFSPCAYARADEPLRIAVAANFSATLGQLHTLYKKQQPQSEILVSSASSGLLYLQITRGAPFDLFLSADELRPRLIEEQGLSLAGFRATYALGILSVVSANDPIDQLSISQYQGKIAIANPKFAPYGRAAKKTLDKLGVSSNKADSLVIANNVFQVAQFVKSGAVELGFVSESQLASLPNRPSWIVPTALYQPIVQQMIIIDQKNLGRLEQAKAFYRFILSQVAQQYIKEQGYESIEQESPNA